MTNLPERRRVAENTLSRLTAQREGLIASLVRTEGKLKDARRKLERIQRAMQKALIKHTEEWHREQQAQPEPVQVPEPTPAPEPKPEPVDDADLEPARQLLQAVNEEIPYFLDRRKKTAGDIADDAARAKIEADKKESEKTRAKVNAEKRVVRQQKLDAKLSGATRRMPLTGRAALAAIKAERRT